MIPLSKISMAVAAAVLALTGAHAPASAACKKMGFLVNDYGEEGPRRDAQLLLDKHIAAWADEEGIDEYSVGKKTVECELFLNFIVFNEHTCTAKATVCWGGSKPSKKKSQTAKAKLASKKVAAKKKSGTAKKVVQSKSETDAKKVRTAVTTKKDQAKATEASAATTGGQAAQTSPAVPYAADAIIRDPGSALPVVRAAVTPAQDTQAPVTTGAVSSERAAADRAAAAAERAAAAAERAAAAAQKAAKAAQEAASLSESRSAVVAPVKPDTP